jgi:hypothetical protein
MTIIYQTPSELITALRDTADEAETYGTRDDLGAVRLETCVAGMRQAADMLEKMTKPVDLRPTRPDIADRVARASAAWPGDYSSIAVALMDGCTTLQPNAADAIASLILLLQSVTKSPEILSPELQERAKQARAWRVQQGEHPQWSAG